MFDVGANRGNRVTLFLELSCQVVAFEPQPDCATDLIAQFGDDPNLTVVRIALAADAGTVGLRLANVDTIASTSKTFIERTTASGRFGQATWLDELLEVRAARVDTAIAFFGLPRFMKIDVEGAEAEVLAGLSEPVRALSFEFARELLDEARRCIGTLCSIGNYEFAFSESESLELDDWMPAAPMLTMLEQLPTLAWGDVYARLDEARP